MFNKQLAEIENKASQTLSQLQWLGNSHWELLELEQARLLKFVLMPHICYGTAIWATEAKRKKLVTLALEIHLALSGEHLNLPPNRKFFYFSTHHLPPYGFEEG